MSNVTISESIKYIGADDTTLDLFESQYIIPNGISYNSYVILDEKVAVMDTIDARKSEEWFNNLSNVLAGRNVDYIVISHLEPDHAANIKALSDKYPDAKLVLSAKAKAMLPQFFAIDNLDDKCITVAEGQELSLGTHNLSYRIPNSKSPMSTMKPSTNRRHPTPTKVLDVPLMPMRSRSSAIFFSSKGSLIQS